jgi:hypothetical protein
LNNSVILLRERAKYSRVCIEAWEYIGMDERVHGQLREREWEGGRSKHKRKDGGRERERKMIVRHALSSLISLFFLVTTLAHWIFTVVQQCWGAYLKVISNMTTLEDFPLGKGETIEQR